MGNPVGHQSLSTTGRGSVRDGNSLWPAGKEVEDRGKWTNQVNVNVIELLTGNVKPFQWSLEAWQAM